MQLKLNNILMRHNQTIKEEVRRLRSKGLSLNNIYAQTNIPKTTIRTWINDIKLSPQQLNILRENAQRALQNGRVKKQEVEKQLRIEKEYALSNKGVRQVGRMTKRDILIAGIALYWAEGFKNKHEHRLGFCNSDPEMIRFYIKWLKSVLEVNEKDLVARLTLNESYKNQTKDIENYWSTLTQIPLNQFTKTFYQKTKWKKQYNIDNYHGVLRIHAKDSLNSLLLMKGFIEGIKSNVIK